MKNSLIWGVKWESLTLKSHSVCDPGGCARDKIINSLREKETKMGLSLSSEGARKGYRKTGITEILSWDKV